MPGEIVSAAQILAGSGAAGWLVDKLLGPSGDALGEQLKVYASDRWYKIFGRVEELAGDQKTNPLPPGFAYLALQKASFSEDDDLITDLWANLLLNASMKFSQRYVLYVDILEKFTADDAKILDGLIPAGLEPQTLQSVQSQLENIRRRCLWTAEAINLESGLSHFDSNASRQFNDLIEKLDFGWPTRIIGSSVPHSPIVSEGSRSATESAAGLANSVWPYDALIRQRMLRTFELDFICGYTIEIEGVMATSLGVEFIQNCRGIKK